MSRVFGLALLSVFAMISIRTEKKDVIWSYVGSIVSMGSGFVLLPFLIVFLSDAELGLWYVFLALSALAQLFEFGFTPAFSRNMVYCLSGVQRLSKNGCDAAPSSGSVNWHLLKTLLKASNYLYATIAIVVTLGVTTMGTAYISYITIDLQGIGHWIAWIVFCLAIFLNMYFLRFNMFLSGVGDVAGENRSRTYSSLVQLALSGILLCFGFGIAAAAVGYLAKGLTLRLCARRFMWRHGDVISGLASDDDAVGRDETKQILSVIAPVAWRNGLDQLALYAATQGSSIVCSLFLGLAETGTYSLVLQFATALSTFAHAFVNSYYPTFQAAYAQSDNSKMRRIIERGVSVYWATFLLGALVIVACAAPVLKVIKPDSPFDAGLFLALAAYVALLQHHTIFCNFILSSNRIPFLQSFVVSSFSGLVLSVLFIQVFHMGAWGLVLGQALPQLAYNNWYWPHYVMCELDASFAESMKNGFSYWARRLKK